MHLPKPIPVDELRIVFEEPTDSSVEIYDINVEIYACFSYLGNWFHIISIFYDRFELFSHEQMGVEFSKICTPTSTRKRLVSINSQKHMDSTSLHGF